MTSVRTYIMCACAIVAIFAGAVFLWPGTLLEAGYMNIRNIDTISYVQKNVIKTQTARRFSDSASIITLANGEQWFAHNGYVSLWFGPDNLTKTYMHMTVMNAALYTEKRENAMAIGFASGISPGVSGLLFDHTDVAEINPAVFDVADVFAEANYNVMKNPAVDVFVEDGIITLAEAEGEYDLILNSVPSPTYYSASKLWTKEVLELMRDRLAPGGIYSGWFDARLESRGMKILLKTLNTVFADCVLTFMSPSYFNTICSNQPLPDNPPAQTNWPKPLQEQFAKHGITDISAFLTDITIDPDPSLYNSADVPLNTLDQPVLEFTSLRADLSGETGDFLATLARSIFTESSAERHPNKCESLRALITSDRTFRNLFEEYCSVEH